MEKTKLNPGTAQPVRRIATAEGKFLNLEDMKQRLQDDRVIDTALAMLKIAWDRKDGPRVAMRHAIGSWLAACAGEIPHDLNL